MAKIQTSEGQTETQKKRRRFLEFPTGIKEFPTGILNPMRFTLQNLHYISKP